MMQGQQGHVTDWDVKQVASWMETVGFGSFVAAFQENGVTGDILVELDRHTLKDLGMMSVGRRVTLLTAIQGLCVQNGLTAKVDVVTPTTGSPAHTEAPVCPSQPTLSPSPSPSSDEFKRLKRALFDQDNRIQQLTQEIERLSTQRPATSEGEQATRMKSPPGSMPRKSSAPARQAEWDGDSYPASGSTRVIRTGSRVRLGSEPHEDQQAESNRAFRPRFQSMPLTPSPTSTSEGAAIPAGSVSPGVGSSTKSDRGSKHNVRVGREDKCFEILPALLKNYQLEDDWRSYALYIAFGTTHRRERFIEHEEKIYPIMRELKCENPVFVLKRVDAEGHTIVRQP